MERETPGQRLRPNYGHPQDPTSVHAANIEALFAAHITAGCTQEPLNYCPSDPVTRAQMAAFLYRARDLISTIRVPAGT